MAIDFVKKYEEHKFERIILSYEGRNYEVLRDKYIVLMSNYLKKQKYYNMPYRELLDNFLDDLNKKLGDNRMAPGCTSGMTFERNFDSVVRKGKKPQSSAAEKRCFHIIRDIEQFFGTNLLIDTEECLNKKNEYIHALLLPLIDLMVKTDLFYYIPHTSKALGYRCYRNQLKMIEDNIEILFGNVENEAVFMLWQEIIEPLRNIIGDGEVDNGYLGGDYPGIKPGIYLVANPRLAYFDCIYDIAQKDYLLYERIITGEYGNIQFNFSIGNNYDEVKASIKERRLYFLENGIDENHEKEKALFFEEFRTAYLDIVKKHMGIIE